MKLLYPLLRRLFNIIVFSVARIRALIWGIFLARLGKKTVFLSGVKIRGPHGIAIGNNVCVNYDSMLDGGGGLTIGDNVMIAQHVIILSSMHRCDRTDIPMMEQGNVYGNVLIGNDVWIGANAVILPGITIGGGSVIGANAVVAKDVPPYAVSAGVPALVLKYRGETSINKSR